MPYSLEGRLRKVGVTVFSIPNSSDGLQCDSCGRVWVPMIRSGGYFYRGFWHCPNGCNRELHLPH